MKVGCFTQKLLVSNILYRYSMPRLLDMEYLYKTCYHPLFFIPKMCVIPNGDLNDIESCSRLRLNLYFFFIYPLKNLKISKKLRSASYPQKLFRQNNVYDDVNMSVCMCRRHIVYHVVLQAAPYLKVSLCSHAVSKLVKSLDFMKILIDSVQSSPYYVIYYVIII